MKLKHVLNEGPISYRGAGGERYAAWEEPDDEGPEYEPEHDEGETVMPYCTSDGTDIKVRVKYELSIDRQEEVTDVTKVELLAVVLPSGKEVDPATASNILGADQFGDEDEDTLAEWLCDHLEAEEGGKFQISDAIRTAARHKLAQSSAARNAAPASAPAAAPATEPTVA